ncbi:MAG: sulfite exporter TauE/SafE family protein [Alphaproteobacteria bacterium]|nr:sulfite exporter TauE/SafE family protein [Alphaproteobacteria bacterium]
MLSVSIIMGFAFLLEACFGFGGAWIAIPLLTLSMLPKDAVFLMLVFQCLKAVLLISSWRHISWKSMNLLFVGMFFGVLIGIGILDVVSPKLFKLGLAIYLMIFVVFDYVNLKMINREWLSAKTGSLLAGFFGGVISGVTGIGGPPYVTYLRAIGLDKLAFRATIIFVVSISNYFRLFLDAGEIIHNEVVLKNFLPCLAVFVVVSVIGLHLPKFLSERVFKTAINAMLFGSSLMLFYKSFA